MVEQLRIRMAFSNASVAVIPISFVYMDTESYACALAVLGYPENNRTGFVFSRSSGVQGDFDAGHNNDGYGSNPQRICT